MQPYSTDLFTHGRNRPFLVDANRYALRTVRGIVVHWTGKSGPASLRRRLIETADPPFSVHYVVDDQTAIQCVPDNEVALQDCGRVPGLAAAANQADGPDSCHLGVSLCAIHASTAQNPYINGAQLSAYLLRKHRLHHRNLYLLDEQGISTQQWRRFTSDVAGLMEQIPVGLAERARVRAADTPVFKDPGTGEESPEQLPEGAIVAVFAYREDYRRIGRNLWVLASALETEKPGLLYFVRETTGAHIRSGPGMQFPVVDAMPHRAVFDVLRQENQWAAIGEQRWVHQSALAPIRVSHGTVVGTRHLNVRSGPGTQYNIVYQLPVGSSVDIWEEHGAWFRIGEDEWVYGSFISG